MPPPRCRRRAPESKAFLPVRTSTFTGWSVRGARVALSGPKPALTEPRGLEERAPWPGAVAQPHDSTVLTARVVRHAEGDATGGWILSFGVVLPTGLRGPQLKTPNTEASLAVRTVGTPTPRSFARTRAALSGRPSPTAPSRPRRRKPGLAVRVKHAPDRRPCVLPRGALPEVSGPQLDLSRQDTRRAVSVTPVAGPGSPSRLKHTDRRGSYLKGTFPVRLRSRA